MALPFITANFSFAYLYNTTLDGANLIGANFTNATLDCAHLSFLKDATNIDSSTIFDGSTVNFAYISNNISNYFLDCLINI